MMTDFGETYRTLNDDAILKLWAERSQLVPPAKASLVQEIHRRALLQQAKAIAQNTPDEREQNDEPYYTIPAVSRNGIAASVLILLVCLPSICAVILESTSINSPFLRDGLGQRLLDSARLAEVLGYFAGVPLLVIGGIIALVVSFSKRYSPVDRIVVWFAFAVGLFATFRMLAIFKLM